MRGFIEEIEKISKIVRTATKPVMVLTVMVMTILLIFSIFCMRQCTVGVIRNTPQFRFVSINMQFCNLHQSWNDRRDKRVTVLTINKHTVNITELRYGPDITVVTPYGLIVFFLVYSSFVMKRRVDLFFLPVNLHRSGH